MNVKLHMGEPEGEITISSKVSSYRPPKLALILLFVAICGIFWGLELESRNDDLGVDCDNPETFVAYEGWGCDAASGLQICCGIIPLLLSFVLILRNISSYEKE